MSPRRARLLVATVWILSFVICFPPLVGWKDKRVTISNLASSLATCPLFLLTFFSPFFSLIPRTTWRLLKTGRSTPPPSLSPWNRALGSASWPTMPATSFIGEQSFANHSRKTAELLLLFLPFHLEDACRWWFFKGSWKVLLWSGEFEARDQDVGGGGVLRSFSERVWWGWKF